MYEHLEDARKCLGYTLDDIGKIVGVDSEAVCNKISGSDDFTIAEACAIHDALFPQYDIRWLFAYCGTVG